MPGMPMPPMPGIPPPMPAHATHAVVAVVVAAGLFFLRDLGDQAVAGQQDGGDRSGVLQRGAVDLGGGDDAALDEVGVLELECVKAIAALGGGDLGDDDGAVLAGVVGDGLQRDGAGPF